MGGFLFVMGRIWVNISASVDHQKKFMMNVDFYPGAIKAGDCVSNGWELVKLRYGMYLGITLLTLVFIGCIPLLNFFVLGPTLGGVYYVFLRDMRGEPVDFGMMFEGFKKFVPLMVVGLIQSIPGIIYQIFSFGINMTRIVNDLGSHRRDFYQSSAPDFPFSGGLLAIGLIGIVVILIFYFLWHMALFFAIPLVMERDLPPVEAIKLSARAAFSNVGGFILLAILSFLVGLLGVLMCVVGAFLISMPVMYAANAMAYRQVFPYFGGETLNNMPPPPGAYGSSFGQGL
jgi:uncharacterized membrane protein